MAFIRSIKKKTKDRPIPDTLKPKISKPKLWLGGLIIITAIIIISQIGFLRENKTADFPRLQPFTTSDELNITYMLKQPDKPSGQSGNPKKPVVIFIHQGGSSKEEWENTDIFNSVVDAGMIAFAYDVRGHGKSDGKFSPILFNDPNLAPKDLIAALKFLRSLDYVDPNKISIVGSSIGANLAIMAKGDNSFGISSVVAISGKTSAAINLAGGDDKIADLSSIFLIAGENEQGGKRAEWAQEFYELSDQPRKIEIVPASKAHGTSLFKADNTLEARILDWIIQGFK